MNTPTTRHTGPLGSTIHVLRADAGTVAELAAIDWNRHFRRVCLDPVRGIITLMAPSRLHEDFSGILDHVVSAAGSVITGAAKGIRSTRLRGRGEPPGTGMEPDCAFYVGERARGYFAVRAEGDEARVIQEDGPLGVVRLADLQGGPLQRAEDGRRNGGRRRLGALPRGDAHNLDRDPALLRRGGRGAGPGRSRPSTTGGSILLFTAEWASAELAPALQSHSEFAAAFKKFCAGVARS